MKTTVFKGLSQLFDDVFGELAINTGRFPPTDINKTETGYQVELAVAGYKRDEIKISRTGNLLEVTGKSKRPTKEGVYSQIAYRDFVRSFSVPSTATVSDVKLEDGLLSFSITFAKPQFEEIQIG